MNNPTRPSYGYVSQPAIGYQMGDRMMCITAMSPVDYIGAVGPREIWDPLAGTGTNRKEDKAHRQAIAEYVEGTKDYVLNAMVVYAAPEEALFVPDDDTPDDAPIKAGILYHRPNAKFTVGDGGHRTDAYGDVITAHEPLKDEVYDKLLKSGQPIIVVLDDDRVRRAQDFTDLQRNSKPLNASIGQSMDRRQLLNRILIEEVIKRVDLPALGGGSRVEFLSDSPGKLSAKTMSYKTLRYASGTLLTGTANRDVRGWDAAVELKLVADQVATVGDVISFWKGFGELQPVAAAFKRDRGVALLREQTWLLSASVIYAIAAAVHESTQAGTTVAQAMAALDTFDFNRGPKSPLNASLVDDDGKAVAGRGAWEAAAEVMAKHIKKGALSAA